MAGVATETGGPAGTESGRPIVSRPETLLVHFTSAAAARQGEGAFALVSVSSKMALSVRCGEPNPPVPHDRGREDVLTLARGRT